MTKKNYEAIARALKTALRNTGPLRTIDAVVEELVPLFLLDNPNFDPTRFRKAVFNDD